MVKGGIAKIAKVVLITVTAIIGLLGVGIFALGIWASLQKQRDVEELLGTGLYSTATYVLIATGIVIAFLSSLGCCGAWKEERFKLGLYFLVLLFAFVILLAGGIMGFMFKDKVEEKLLEQMIVTVRQYGEKEPVTNAWNAIQAYYKCCGFVMMNSTKESYEIWEGNDHLKNESLTVPPTCCKDIEKQEECQKDPETNVHKDDCYVLLKAYFKKNAKVIGALAIGIALFLVIGMLMTCYVYRALKVTYTRDLMENGRSVKT